MSLDPSLVRILPRTAGLTPDGHLALGGCDAVELAREFGTPLYIFDEVELREACREWLAVFRSRYPRTTIVYAAKAYIGQALAALIAEEGLGLDLASGGELAIARSAAFLMEAVYLHGNNKSTQELREALDADVGHVVIDNFREAALLNDIALETKQQQPVLLRLSPNIDPHTHRYIATGALDSKFGAAIATGQAEEAVLSLMASPGLRPVGLHAHIGSQILETEPFGQAVRTIVEFGARMRERHGFDMQQVSAGGGYAVQYLRGTPAPSRADYAEAVVSALTESCRAHAVPLPQLVVEPGRSVVARAGVALYSVGSRKEIPGVRTYLAVDGGMADNIRPALYGAAYDALVANRPGDIGPHESVTIAGKYCESGDILVRDADLPKLWAGDVLAIPVSGAYCLPLASNYNASLRPAVVFVNDGQARLVRRRETYEDLRRCEVSEP